MSIDPAGKNEFRGLEVGQEKDITASNPASIKNSEEDSDSQYVTGFKLYMVVFAVTLAGFLIALDASIVVTAIPRITNEFNSIADIGWYGSGYLIANCACQPSTGKIYQYYSSKYTFIVFLAIFEIGSLICGVATSSSMLIIGRAIAGIGGSGILNGGLAIIAAAAPAEERTILLGVIISFSMLGVVVGPLLGGIITQDASWRWCFYINLPAGGITAAILLILRIPDGKEKTDIKPTFKTSLYRLDPLGFVAFAPACVMLLLALEWGGTKYPWNSATIIGLLCGGVATACVFLAWEQHRGDTSMMPLGMLRQRVIYSSCIVAICQMGGMQIFAYYLPIWFQVIKDASPTMSGVYFMATIIPLIMAAMLSGVLISKLGYYTPWAIGGNLLAAIGSGIMSTLIPSTSTGQWIGYQILAGTGRGMVMQQPITAVQAILPANQFAVGTALVVFSQYFGGALFIAFAQTIFTNSLGPALEEFAPGVEARAVLSVGATELRNMVGEGDIEGVLLAYNKALTHTWYLAAASAAVGFVASWGLGWGSVKKAKTVMPEA